MTLSHRLRVASSTGGITTDGLAFHIDAGNPLSYSTAGGNLYKVNSLVGSISNDNGSGYDGTVTHTAASGSNPAYWTYPSNITFGQVYGSSEFDLVSYPSYSFDGWYRVGANGNQSWGRIFSMLRHAYSPNSINDSIATATRLNSIYINASQTDNPSISWFQYYSGGGNTGTNYINQQITTPNMGTGGWLQNKWFHFTVVNDASGFGYRRYYVDSVRVNNTQYGSSAYTSHRNPAYPNNNGTFYLYLGGSMSSQVAYEGDFSIARFYKNKILSDQEVVNNWNAERALFGR